MFDIYMWNKNTDNKIFITSFSTGEEAEKYIRENSTSDFVYYAKYRKLT